MANNNPMSTPEPWSQVASGYVVETKPYFEQYCKEAIRLSGFDSGGRVLDVACGPGTLSLLLHQQADQIDAIDFSPTMLEYFDQAIEQQGIGNINTQVMDGQNLDFADNGFDYAFSNFGLMFFPDRARGFREMHRTLKPGGRAAVTSWAPVSDSSLFQMMFGAMTAAFPPKQDGGGDKILNLDDPDVFKDEMQQAGFSDVTISHYDGSMELEDVEQFLDTMSRNSAPIVMLKNQLDEDEWQQKRAIMLDWLKKQIPEVPTTLTARAYIGIGHK